MSFRLETLDNSTAIPRPYKLKLSTIRAYSLSLIPLARVDCYYLWCFNLALTLPIVYLANLLWKGF